MKVVADFLNDTLEAYLEEYGPDGYTEVDFVDFVVVQVIKPSGAPEMIEWYRRRAVKLERTMRRVCKKR